MSAFAVNEIITFSFLTFSSSLTLSWKEFEVTTTDDIRRSVGGDIGEEEEEEEEEALTTMPTSVALSTVAMSLQRWESFASCNTAARCCLRRVTSSAEVPIR